MTTNCKKCNFKISNNTIKKHYLNNGCGNEKYKYIIELFTKDVFRAMIGVNEGTTLNELDEFIRKEILKEVIYEGLPRHISEFDFKNDKESIIFMKNNKRKWKNTMIFFCVLKKAI